tara:strand:+ start:236 stop:1543 length:1308 start_codon:yes stop_codon:yes gene_type:complete
MEKKNRKKIVYVGLAADILHKGHINIIEKAKNLGEVIVGLLTDEAISSYKKLPYLNYEQREIVVKNMKSVSKVVPQKTLSYIDNLKLLKPDYVVHGDDWKKGIQKKTRSDVIRTLKKWSGKLIEPKYTSGISSTKIKKKIFEVGTTPENRKSRLKRLMNSKGIVRVMESHSALTGLIIENISTVKGNSRLEFDAMWSSSLTDSALKGKPDNQVVDYSSRMSNLSDLLDVTTKPIIFDADNGGRLEHISYLVKSLERLGVSAMVIEDKVGLKKNSLFKDQKNAHQDTIKNFSKKIKKASESKLNSDFMILARIESLILGKSIQDALKRAEAYSKSGADAIVIHSKDKNPNEIFKFASIFKKSKYYKPMISIPSTYSSVYENQLIKNGFKIVIYANQLMRASYSAMLNTAKDILKNQRSKDIESKICSVSEIINLIK